MKTRELLVKHGCVLEGEFFIALKSGLVSDKYVNMDPILSKPDVLGQIASVMADRLCDLAPEIVAGPALGAVPLAYMVREKLFLYHQLRPDVVFAEKEGDDFILKRKSFKEGVNGKTVVVVEDIGTTGSSARKTAEAIVEAGGIIKHICFIWNRGGVTADSLGFPMSSLISENIRVYELGEHPEWEKWPLVTDIGHSENLPSYCGPTVELGV